MNIAERNMREVRYSYDGAKKDFGHILKAHNNGTSWSNIKLNS